MSQLFILYLGSLMLRSMGVAALAAACAWLTPSVARRHALWSAVLGIMLLMPAVDRVLPMSQPPATLVIAMMQSTTELSAAMHVESPASPASVIETIATSKHWDWWLIAASFYGVVTALLAFQMSMAHRKLRNIKRLSRRISTPLFDDPIAELRESDSVRIPITVGFLRPFVILPADWRTWDEWKLRAVLMHELAHVRRADWIVSMLAALNTIVFWYNPLAWWLERRIGRLCEEASDEACVSGLGDPARYSEVLLQFATAQVGSRLGAGVAMARRNIASRIERILTIHRPECGVLTRTSAAIVFVLAIPVLYTVATIHAEPEGATTFALGIPAPPTLSEQSATASSLVPVSLPVPVAKGSKPREAEQAQPEVVGTLTGTIFGPGGSMAEGTRVTLSTRENKEVRSTLTNRFCEFEMVGVPAGSYWLRAESSPNSIGGPFSFMAFVDLTQSVKNKSTPDKGPWFAFSFQTTPLPAAAEAITLRFEIYKNGVLLGSPMIRTGDGISVSVRQNQLSVSVLPRRSSADTIQVDCTVMEGDRQMQTNILVSYEKAGTISWQSPADSMELRIVALPNKPIPQ